MRQASKELGINHKSIQEWVSIYKSKGPVGITRSTTQQPLFKKIKTICCK